MPDNRRLLLSALFNDLASPVEREARETLDIAAQKTADTLLLGAIAANDPRMFEQAIGEGADVNANGGRPLAQAAQEKNFLFMRKLLTRGADIETAIATLETEQGGITRKKNYDDYWDRTTYTYKSKADERRYKQITVTMKTIRDYEKLYLEKIAPLEAVRLQQEIADDIAVVRRLTERAVTGGNVLKPKLKAPGGQS
ncbi:MAG TPA: hypothetical protein VEF76_03110 [Patescibacteria group bacterium]|nr:hypothetical protein [Patescibacteria group bacterium]